MNAHDADAVLRDDALLDALSRGELPVEFARDRTAQLLFAWQDDLCEPITELTAEPTPLGSRRLLWLSRRVTVAAAIGVLAAGSAGSVAAASMAEPGDALWPITKVVYTERAASIEAREDALSTIAEARVAAKHHHPDQAKRLLNEAAHKAGLVRDGDERDAIAQEVAKVLATLDQPQAPAEPSPAAPDSAPLKPTPQPDPVPPPASPAPPPPSPDPAGPVEEASPSAPPSSPGEGEPLTTAAPAPSAES